MTLVYLSTKLAHIAGLLVIVPNVGVECVLVYMNLKNNKYSL